MFIEKFEPQCSFKHSSYSKKCELEFLLFSWWGNQTPNDTPAAEDRNWLERKMAVATTQTKRRTKKYWCYLQKWQEIWVVPWEEDTSHWAWHTKQHVMSSSHQLSNAGIKPKDTDNYCFMKNRCLGIDKSFWKRISISDSFKRVFWILLKFFSPFKYFTIFFVEWKKDWTNSMTYDPGKKSTGASNVWFLGLIGDKLVEWGIFRPSQPGLGGNH